ncbi:MAG: VOC family protein [Actinomycetota bacterium]|nr:VOC family protein [Actinomycetota bacterium]
MEHTMRSDDGVARHATIRVGDSLLMVSKGTDIYGRVPLMLHLYVDDVDQIYADALEAGGLSQREPRNEFYGDRVAAIKDDWENQWWIATHVEDVGEEELRQREKAVRDGA